MRRGTPLGNQFYMHDESRRDTVCDAYDVWIRGKIRQGDPVVMEALQDLVDRVLAGQDIKLGCYCAPKRCHCDTIRTIVLSMVEDQKKMKRIRHSRHSGYDVGVQGDTRYHPAFCQVDGEYISTLATRVLLPMGHGLHEQRWTAYYAIWQQWASQNAALLEELLVLAQQNDETLRDEQTVGVITHIRALAQLLTERYYTQPA